MFARIRFLLCAAFCVVAGFSHAQPIDERTKCAVVAGIMDAPHPDMRKVTELSVYILSTMRTVDHSYGVRDKVEILPRMTGDGIRGVIATASVRCRDHPEATIRDIAIEFL